MYLENEWLIGSSIVTRLQSRLSLPAFPVRKLFFQQLMNFPSTSSASRMPVRSKRNIARRSSTDDTFYDSMPKGKIVKSVSPMKNYALNKKIILNVGGDLSKNDDEANNN